MCSPRGGGGHSYIRVTYKCHQAPQTYGSFGDRSNQKNRGSFGDRSKITGSFSESVVKRGAFGNRLTNLKFMEYKTSSWPQGYKSLKILASVIVTNQSMGQIIKMLGFGWQNQKLGVFGWQIRSSGSLSDRIYGVYGWQRINQGVIGWERALKMGIFLVAHASHSIECPPVPI